MMEIFRFYSLTKEPQHHLDLFCNFGCNILGVKVKNGVTTQILGVSSQCDLFINIKKTIPFFLLSLIDIYQTYTVAGV